MFAAWQLIGFRLSKKAAIPFLFFGAASSDRGGPRFSRFYAFSMSMWMLCPEATLGNG